MQLAAISIKGVARFANLIAEVRGLRRVPDGYDWPGIGTANGHLVPRLRRRTEE